MDERQLRLSRETFGPYWMMHVLPWLLLATTMRFLSFHPHPVAGVAGILIESLAIFLAFLTALRRGSEDCPPPFRLGAMSFSRQVELAVDIVGKVYVLLFALAVASYFLGTPRAVLLLLRGLDGIAYDQFIWGAMAWSAALAALLALMVMNADATGRALARPSAEFLRGAVWVLPAVAAAALALIGISTVEGFSRGAIGLIWQTPLPQFFKNASFFLFVFGFATLRLWVVTKILLMALAFSRRITFDRSDKAPDASH